MHFDSKLVDGHPWTMDDDLLLDELSDNDKARVLRWIENHVFHGKAAYPLNSYGLKHYMENDIGIYTTNNQFKDAMLRRGFYPIDDRELNWEYRVWSDRSPDKVREQEELERKKETERKIFKYINKGKRNFESNQDIVLNHENNRIIIGEKNAYVNDWNVTNGKIVLPLARDHLAEILVDDTGIIYFDKNTDAFSSVLDYYTHNHIVNLMGKIGEAIIVHRCNDNTEINGKWLAIVKRDYFPDPYNLDQYKAVGTGFSSTKRLYPQIYDPENTQNDIVWIDGYGKRVLQNSLDEDVGIYAGLQVKASTDGYRYLKSALVKKTYEVPIAYYSINNDYEKIIDSLSNINVEAEFIDVRDIDRGAFDEFMWYYELLIAMKNGKISATEVMKKAQEDVPFRQALFATSSELDNMPYIMIQR